MGVTMVTFEVDVIADSNLAVVLYGQVVVAKELVAYGGVGAVVEEYRPLHEHALAHAAQYLLKQLRAVLHLILGRAVVFGAQVVRTQLYLP